MPKPYCVYIGLVSLGSIQSCCVSAFIQQAVFRAFALYSIRLETRQIACRWAGIEAEAISIEFKRQRHFSAFARDFRIFYKKSRTHEDKSRNKSAQCKQSDDGPASKEAAQNTKTLELSDVVAPWIKLLTQCPRQKAGSQRQWAAAPTPTPTAAAAVVVNMVAKAAAPVTSTHLHTHTCSPYTYAFSVKDIVSEIQCLDLLDEAH